MRNATRAFRKRGRAASQCDRSPSGKACRSAAWSMFKNGSLPILNAPSPFPPPSVMLPAADQPTGLYGLPRAAARVLSRLQLMRVANAQLVARH